MVVVLNSAFLDSPVWFEPAREYWLALTSPAPDSEVPGRGNFRIGKAGAAERRGLEHWFQGYWRKSKVGVLLLVSEGFKSWHTTGPEK